MLRVLDASLPAVNLAALDDPENEELLLECVADSVGAARYYQDPDALDLALADPRIQAALAPVATRIAAAPAAKWWSDPVDPSKQVYVDKREDGSIRPPVFSGAQVVLEAWRNGTTGPGRRHRGQWVGGPWWSTPVSFFTVEDIKRYGEPLPRVAGTTRSRPGLGAVELLLEEDSFGALAALCWPVRARMPVRTCGRISCFSSGSTQSGQVPGPGSAIATSASAATPSVFAGDHRRPREAVLIRQRCLVGRDGVRGSRGPEPHSASPPALPGHSGVPSRRTFAPL
ncbi:MAG: hypothetical protein ACLPXU_02750 [Acidimicrobiales bacterium]